MFLVDFDCVTAAGFGRETLMNTLFEGRVCSRAVGPEEWSRPAQPGGLVAFLNREKPLKITGSPAPTKLEIFVDGFQKLTERVCARLPLDLKNELKTARIGFIFASTKGDVEDFIYSSDPLAIRQARDPFIEVTEAFKKQHSDINWKFSATISNACSSSHVALEYAQDLLEFKALDYVFVLAADLIGPFIYNGFNSLKVLSHTRNLPFAADRDGLQLGEALSLLILSHKQTESGIAITSVASDTEGTSITRPSVNGVGLLRTLEKVRSKTSNFSPDAVIAHGTGTQFNDRAEDQALDVFFNGKTPLISNTKWSIGHTLGASGSIDLIAAAQALKSQKLFSIATHSNLDSKLRSNYFLKSPAQSMSLKQILITSLGFGGVHASLLVEALR
jgi:hypothetical protein